MNIVAEIASAHMGDANKCIELTNAAYEAGADGIKYQIWTQEDIKHSKYFNNLKRFELTFEEWESITQMAKILDMDVWLETFSHKTTEFAAGLMPDFFKINYNEFLMNPVYDNLTSVPIFWRIQSDMPVYGNHVAIGEQTYPTTRIAARDEIQMIKSYKERGYEVIYADHQLSYGLMDDLERDCASIAAMQAGADFIEKHICLNREDLKAESRDYISALEPGEFEDYVKFMKTDKKVGIIL